LKFLPYLGRRVLFFLPQILGVLLVTFLITRAIPGDPARLQGGPYMPLAGLELIRKRMGLNEPIYLQFVYYVRNILRGDLGYSYYTSNPVLTDILLRLPATLELIVLAFLLTFVVMIPTAVKSVSRGKGMIANVIKKAFFAYGMAAGATPDFWLALILLFVFYSVLGWIPSPVGQMNIAISPPTRITGMYIVDSLVTGNWISLKSSLLQAVLPVFALAFVHGGGICKIAIVASINTQKAGFINFAKVCGLPPAKIQKYINRHISLPVITMTAISFGFLLGGAVLVETVFSWGGFGQYAVQAIINTDYAAIQGVILVSALLNLFVYMLVDMIYFWVDPRIKSLS